MLKKATAFLLCLLTIAILTACGSKGQESSADKGKIKVAVTFNALKEFASAVGGNKVAISTIIPNGTEPHDFEPKPKDLASLSQMRIFVYNGLDMETWAEKAINAAKNKNLISVEASKGVNAISDSDTVEKGGQVDPHSWLSLKGAEIEAQNIRDALIQADPTDKNYFENNYNHFAVQLEALYTEYTMKFQAAKNKNFVTGHAAFAYLCRDFGLSQNSVEDVFADGEPSAQQLTKLADYCRKNSVKTIFVEDMVSPAISETLAREVGAKVKTIYTIESSEDNKNYLERMKNNLAEIYSSLSK